jgi:hypothetical protein
LATLFVVFPAWEVTWWMRAKLATLVLWPVAAVGLVRHGEQSVDGVRAPASARTSEYLLLRGIAQ